MDFNDDLLFEIQCCDTLFKTIDKDGDCQLSYSEFEAYVTKRNSHEEAENILRDFKNIDIGGDGNIQFIEFLRAACIKKDLYIPEDISIFDKLRIYQVIDYRHITKKEMEELN